MSESILQSDDLGNLGELAFAWLTGKPPFTVNKVQRDRNGWDFIVELPLPSAEGLALDAKPGLATILVQVKATYRSPKPQAVRLTLSAADRLAKRPGPSFLVAIAFDRRDHEKYDVYVIEMLDDALSAVLKALRKRQYDGKRQINHSSISFLLKKSSALGEANGQAFLERLLVALRDGEEAYIDRKKSQRRSLGYGPDRLTGKMTMHGVTVTDLADILIGKRDFHATISDVEERRFGIVLPSNQLPVGEGVGRFIPKSKGACQVKIGGKPLKRPLSFVGQYFEVALPSPTHLVRRARYDFGVLEIEREDDKVSIRPSVTQGDGDGFPIARWVDVHRAWLALAEGPATVEILGHSFEWQFKGSGKRDETFRNRLDLFETTQRLLDEVGLSAEPILSRDIYRQQKEIYAIVGMSIDDARSIRIGFQTDRDVNDDFPTRRLLANVVDLGKYRIASATDITLRQAEGEGDREWFATANDAVSLEIIDRTPLAFQAFTKKALDKSKMPALLVNAVGDALDEAFVAQALGDIEPF